MKIGITGGIGSGKSHVCALLRKRGISVYSCDDAAKRLMRTSGEMRQRLDSLIGKGTFAPEGAIDKAHIAAFLLASEANAKAIDAIVHPAVARDFELSGEQWMECAIMFESGFNRLVDKVVAVSCPDNVRISRIVRRDGITPDKAKEWLARQWPQEKTLALADYVIRNDGESDLESQIDHILGELNL